MRILQTWIPVLLISLCLAASRPAGASVPAPVAGAEAPIRIGVLAYRNAEFIQATWQPMLAHLNHTLSPRVFELLQADHATLQQAVREGTIDFVLTNPGHYVELETSLGASRIATLHHERSPTADYALGAAVIARSDRTDLQQLSDLRRKRLAATTPEGFGGYQIVWRELKDLGIDPEKHLEGLLYTGLPMENVLQAIRDGKADAGIVRACVLESIPDWQAHFRVLSPRTDGNLACAVSTRLYPDWPIASLRHTDPALSRAVIVALLQMPPDRQGISWSVPADYQSVHELFRDLQIGPYAYLREPSLRALAREYWSFLAIALLLLLCGIFYTVRVEHLVHKRTAALQAALKEGNAMRERMRAHQEQTHHLSRLSILGELSATLAHELNQPLAGIANYGQSLLRRMERGALTDAAVQQASTEIVAQAGTAAGILQRIRSFARKRPPQREMHKAHAVVGDTLALFRSMLSSPPDIVLDNRLPDSACIHADALQIQQILLNLLKNGLDAMRQLPEQDRRMHVGLSLENGLILIAIRDYGHGLDGIAPKQLFEPFRTTKEDGLGLGLSICEGIAEVHEGRLDASMASDGPGMIFTLALPAHEC